MTKGGSATALPFPFTHQHKSAKQEEVPLGAFVLGNRADYSGWIVGMPISYTKRGRFEKIIGSVFIINLAVQPICETKSSVLFSFGLWDKAVQPICETKSPVLFLLRALGQSCR